MPFTDTPDGQTHYQNDGCGVKAHNDMQEQKAWYEDGMNAYANGVEEALGYCHREELRQYTEWMIQKATERGREEGLREEREKIGRDLNNWCEIQKKRWETDGSISFISGAFSGYAWLQDHIPHLISGVECRCPGHDSLLSQQEGK